MANQFTDSKSLARHLWRIKVHSEARDDMPYIDFASVEALPEYAILRQGAEQVYNERCQGTTLTVEDIVPVIGSCMNPHDNGKYCTVYVLPEVINRSGVTPLKYAVTMHELGHALAPNGSGWNVKNPNTQELVAWEWALDNVLTWNRQCHDMLCLGLEQRLFDIAVNERTEDNLTHYNRLFDRSLEMIQGE